MRYLVLGCGPKSMGKAIAKRLLQETDSIVYVGDQLAENEHLTVEELQWSRINTGSAILRADPRPYGFDVIQNKSRLHDVFRNCDIVINALPASFAPLIVEAVLQTNESKAGGAKRTHYCDLGGVLEVTKKILSKKNRKRAELCGASIVPECGFQPGAGNIHAVELYEKYFGTGVTFLKAVLDSLIIYVGGLPKTPPHYKELFNLKGLEEIYYNSPLVLSGGKPKKIRRLAHYETMNSARFGLYFGDKNGIEMEAAITGGLGALPYYMKEAVRTLQEKTLRYSGHYEFVKNTPRDIFIKSIKELTAKCPKNEKDYCLMHIEAIGFSENTGKKIKVFRTLYVESDNDFNSMQKTTGFTAAVIANMIVKGKAKPGANPPEIALNPEETIEALSGALPIIQEYTTPFL